MAKAWKDVVASPQYQQLSPQEQSEAQEEYFNTVVAPHVDNVDAAKQEFYGAYPVNNQPAQQDQQSPQMSALDSAKLGVKEAGKGLAQAAVNVANIPGSIVNTALDALGVPKQNQVMTLQLPESLQPQTDAGKIAASALPYLTGAGELGAGAKAAEAVANSGGITKAAQGLTSLAADNLVGTLADNSNNNQQNLPEDLAESMALGGALKGVGNAVGASYRALKGQITPEAQAAIDFAEKNNVPLLTSDVAQPNTFASKAAQGLAEKLPFVGTGDMRANQQAARKNLVDNYVNQFGQPSAQDIVDSLQRQTSKVKQAAGNRLSNINDAMTGKPVDVSNTLSSIDNEIGRLSKLGGVADNQTISKLQAYRDEISQTSDFDQLRNLRSQFRQDVKGERLAMPNMSDAATNRVYGALTGDINSAVGSNLGQDALSKYQQANAVYANEAQNINRTRLKNVLEKGNLTPELVNNLLFSNKPSDIQRLYGSLDNNGRSAARSAIIGKAYESANGSPDSFLNNLNKLSKQTGVFFKGDDQGYLQGLSKYLDSTREAAKANVTAKNGQEWLQAGPLIATGVDLAHGGFGTMTAAGYGLLSRMYENPVMRNAVLKLNGTAKNSTAFEKQLNNVNNGVNVLAQGYKNQDGS